MVTQIASDRAGIRNPTGRLQIVRTESLYDYVINSIKNFLPIDPRRKKKLYAKKCIYVHIYQYMF